jgi:hypothetical protein
MLDFFKKNKKIIKVVSIIFLVSFFVVIVYPKIAYAQDATDIATSIGSAVTGALAWTGQKLLNMIALLLYWVALIIGVLMSFSAQALSYLSDPQYFGMDYEIVHQGWTVTRDIANMGFIIALLLISFSTIFGIQTYHAKALLPRLILVALIVNYSLEGVLIIVGACDVIMKAIIGGAGDTNPAGTLAAIQHLPDLLNLGQGTNVFSSSSGQDAANAAIFLRLIIAIVIFGGMTICFLGTALLFLVRLIVLMFLAIAAPLALVALLLPNTRTYFDQWFKKLIQYAFMGPFLLFMVLLTLTLSIGFIAKMGDLAVKQGGASGGSFFTSGWSDLAPSIIGATFIIVCLIISMKVASASGIYGANLAYNLKTWAAVAATSASKSYRAANKLTYGGLDKMAEGIIKRSPKLARLSGLSALYGVRQRGKAEDIGKWEKSIANLSQAEVLERLKSGAATGVSATQHAALLNKAAKDGYMDDALAAAGTRKVSRAATAGANTNEILKRRPDLAPALLGGGDEAIRSALREHGLSAITGAAWQNANVMRIAHEEFSAGEIDEASKGRYKTDQANKGYEAVTNAGGALHYGNLAGVQGQITTLEGMTSRTKKQDAQLDSLKRQRSAIHDANIRRVLRSGDVNGNFIANAATNPDDRDDLTRRMDAQSASRLKPQAFDDLATLYGTNGINKVIMRMSNDALRNLNPTNRAKVEAVLTSINVPTTGVSAWEKTPQGKLYMKINRSLYGST